METSTTSIAYVIIFFKEKLLLLLLSLLFEWLKKRIKKKSYNVSFRGGSDFKFLNGQLSLSDSTFKGYDKVRNRCTEQVNYSGDQ